MQRFIIALTIGVVAAAGFVNLAFSNEQIAYTQCQSYYDEWDNEVLDCRIMLTDPAGVSTVALADGTNPSWSPDGTRIAFGGTGRAYDWNSGAISVLDLQTGAIKTLTNTGSDYSPSWSPNGSRIAFTSNRSGSGVDVYVMDSNGDNVQQVTVDGRSHWFAPGWLSDTSLVFSCLTDSTTDLCTVNLDGSNQQTLLMDSAQPSVSVSKRLIFSTAWSGVTSYLATMNPDGSDFQTIGEFDAKDPVWSPDATHIAFDEPRSLCDASGYCNDLLFVANADGTNAQLIGGGYNPSWTNTPLTHFAAPPVAQIFAWCDVATCTFDGSGSWDNDSTPSLTWDFGDGTTGTGTTGTGTTVTHTYASHATVTITLTATDADGLTSTQTRQMVVANHPPTASFTFTCTGRTCTFDASASSDAEGPIASYAWNFGDGAVGSGPVATHTYASAGTHSMYLTVYDSDGVGTLQWGYVTITNIPPSVAFTVSCTGLTCAFDGSTSSDADGTIFSYSWNFGDGSTGSGKTVTHNYASAGTFNATLTVTDNEGATASASRAVTVARPLMHSGDLDGLAERTPPNWKATVTVTIHNAVHAVVSNATVNASWSTGQTSTCVTNAAGQCAMSLSSVPSKTAAVTLTVQTVTHAQYDYQAGANHDPDGDSNGTTITLKKP